MDEPSGTAAYSMAGAYGGRCVGRVPAPGGVAGGGSRDGFCGEPVEAGTPVPLCRAHVVEAYEWVAGDVGVTDVLPSPCPACGSRLGVSYPSGWLCAVCEWRHGEHPDPEAVAVRVDVVYYIRWRDRIKIGTSSNPRARIAQLAHDEVLAFERGTRAREQARHVEFAHLRLGGEWFEASGALLTHVQALQAGADDPWTLHARWLSEAAARPGPAQ